MQLTIQDAIKSLGKSKGSVTRQLRKLKVKGITGSGYFCPIARYLEKCGIKQPSVGNFVSISTTDEIVNHPKHIAEWILDFDSGKYTEFEE